MSDPGRFVDESFRTPQGQSPPDQDQSVVEEDPGASPELTTRSGKKRKFPAQPTRSSTKKSKMAKPVTSAEIQAMLKASMEDVVKSMGGMENRIKGKIEAVEEKVGQTNEDLRSLETRVSLNEKRTDERIDRLENLLEHQNRLPALDPERLVAPSLSGCSGSFHTALGSVQSGSGSFDQTARNTRRMESYWHCRKSLRLWPVDGPDLRDAVVTFLQDELKFERGDVDREDVTVERFHENKKNAQKLKKEVVVTFATVSLRDAVRSAAFNLRSGFGMRIHVPDFLKANFRHLDSMCYELKKKFPDLKRNIKFDDDLLDMFADVQLRQDGQWQRLLPADARLARAKGNFVPDHTPLTSDVLGELLGDENPDRSGPLTGANSAPIGQPAAPKDHVPMGPGR